MPSQSQSCKFLPQITLTVVLLYLLMLSPGPSLSLNITVVNITKALTDGHSFNVLASMLSASGVVKEIEADEGGAGITMFIPADEFFADLPPFIDLQSLPADKKAIVLKFHVVQSYYPLHSLQSIVNPLQPTLATEARSAGTFTRDISGVNGSVSINTAIVQASVTRTVLDHNPVAIFGVSKVLLPPEIFGKNPFVSAKLSQQGGGAPKPVFMVLSTPHVKSNNHNLKRSRFLYI